jgi:hypothetical protein
MLITAKTLPNMEDRDQFVEIYTGYVIDTLNAARLFPKFSIQRIVDAHGAWKNDLSRVGDNEPKLDDGLDHFKQCGHLAFWLRRMAPLVEAADLTENVGDAPGYPIGDDEQAFRNLLFGYANEYLAFDLGFQVCKYYELSKREPSERARTVSPTTDYYTIMCHYLKYKTVSPHAMFAIYKSIFL